MADIKDIFGESDSEDDNDQQQAPVDVGKLFELSEDEEEAPIQRKRPAGRLQKNAAAAPPNGSPRRTKAALMTTRTMG